MGGFVASVVVVVGLLTAACSSSASPAASTTQVADTTPATTAPPSNWSTVDINTGSITPSSRQRRNVGGLLRGVPRPHEGRLQPVLQLGDSRPHGEPRWHAGPPCLSGGIGWRRRAVVAGWLAARVSAAGRLGRPLGNLFVQNLATGQRTRVTNLDQKEWGWWLATVGPLRCSE